MLVSFCFVTDYGDKHTCSVTGCNINSIYKDGIQTLKITLWGHHMEAKEKENICYTMILFNKSTEMLRWGHLLFSRHTHKCFKGWNSYIFNTIEKNKHYPIYWKTHFTSNIYKEPKLSRNTSLEPMEYSNIQ